MNQPAKIRIALIDDHPMVLEGLSSLLSKGKNFNIVATGSTAQAAFDIIREHHPDVLLLDNRLPDTSGIQICREIRETHPKVKVIILTSYLDEEAVMDSVHAGAHGYLLKEVDVDELTDAIQQVCAGESVMPARVTQSLISGIRQQDANRETTQKMDLISPQELKVMQLVADGCINKEIATELNLSEKTVKNYLSNIFVKLDMQRRSQVAAFYTRYHKETS